VRFGDTSFMSLLGSSKIAAFSATTNAERAKTFYRDQLGLTLVSDEPFALVFDANGTMLRVQKVKEVREAQYTSLGWNVSDIAATIDALEKAGVKFEHYGFPGQDEKGIWTPPGSTAKIAWFKDPDGNILSLAQF
jgi:catechol 2,3-dioxygenase-like lactoylglutathione lyase family enzyme